MKILVLGAGRMGHGAVFDLAYNSSEVEAVTVADADFAKAQAAVENANSAKVSAIELDVSDYEKCVSAMRVSKNPAGRATFYVRMLHRFTFQCFLPVSLRLWKKKV